MAKVKNGYERDVPFHLRVAVLEVVVAVDVAWLCVVINRKLCEKGEEVVREEIRRLTKESFVDFHLVDDGYENDCYCFVKCSLGGNYMEKFRACHYITTVLDSYDSPAYLSDAEVEEFISSGNEREKAYFSFGDIVTVEGEGTFADLHGVVVGLAPEHSMVLFKFHTVSLREWIRNDELIFDGNVFYKVKFPVTDVESLQPQVKHPFVQEDCNVCPGEPDRFSDRENEEDEM